MKHRFLLSFAILLAVVAIDGPAVFAQAGRTIALQEAIDLSVRNSKQLKGSRAKIDEATANLREAVERQRPEVALSGSHIRLNSPNIDVKVKSNSNSGG